MIKSFTLLLLASMALAAMPVAAQAIPQVLRVCGDLNEFPPYTYRTGRDGKKGSEVRGYNVDVLRILLAASKRSASYRLLPWKRCLAMSAAGQFDIVLDAGNSPDRRRDYHLALGHYRITPIYLYSTARPVAEVRNKVDLLRYRRCEILGWDYSASGVPNAEDLVTRPATVEAAIAMLRGGRCELMVYDLELVKGMQHLHGPSWMDGLSYGTIPWLPFTELHFGVSRRLPYAQALTTMLNEGVAALLKQGEATRLLERHLPK